MQYLINRIVELIAQNEPAPDGETIILVNGFESLKLYEEIAARLSSFYQGSGLSLNIKLAKRKWEALCTNSDSVTIEQMKQNRWVAEKESVTFYRNQHDANLLVLLGTEEETDTGGLANCFTITPDWLVLDLDGRYDRVFKSCFTIDITEDDAEIINKAYRCLFEYCPIDICKLSDIADSWASWFDSINEFCAEFGKHLTLWGLPGNYHEAIKIKSIMANNNFLHNEKDFISGKLFQRMSQKAYKTLEKKLESYPLEGHYDTATINWPEYGLHDYDDFVAVVLEFARGENVQANRERLLKMDYVIINDILKTKGSTQPPRVSVTSLSGEPIDIVLRTTLSLIKKARDNNRRELNELLFEFSSADIVTGYTDADDEEKHEVLVETWNNICVHVNGLFEFVEQNAWNYYGEPLKIVCSTPDFFDPTKVNEQVGSTVNVVSGTNTLNKINFTVTLRDENGDVLRENQGHEEKDMSYHYCWKFDNEAFWLYDYKDLILDSNLSAPHASRIPVGVMQRIKNMMIAKSEEEFFDTYDEDSLDLGFDLCHFVGEGIDETDDYELKQLGILFSDLGKAFCSFVSELSKKGFYKVLCGDSLANITANYIAVADKILSIRFAENKQWLMDAFLQAFVIQDSTSYLREDMEPKCVIIPPWHPAALQKISDQKKFMIDGLSQKLNYYDENRGSFDIDGTMDRFIHMTEIQSSIDLFPADGNDYMGVLGTFGHFCVYGREDNVSSVRTRMKDVLRKEAIYDDEFRASELTKMNDDAQMIYDVLKDYNKAMPYAKCALSIAFINPPDLQPIVSAISKYTKEIHSKTPDAIINLQLSILVRQENKGGKNYLTYWMDEYFSEEKNTSVRIYLNEWAKKAELDKLLSDNNDIIFNMDLLHAETFSFISNHGDTSGKVSDCRFPIVYKPTPISKSSKKRRIEITQTQFSVSFKHTQVVRYKKNPEVIPDGTYLAVRVTNVESETKQIIDMLHKKAYWVVCIDKVMDGALLRGNDTSSDYAIIGFSTGKGMYGQYNLTITARNSILETVERKLKNRLYRMFKWKSEILDEVVKKVMDEARSLDGISMLSAINQKGTNINEFMAYVMTSLRERQSMSDSALKVIIHLDSYKHWFDNRAAQESSSRPDFLMLSVVPDEKKIKLKATVIECKTASFKNYDVHVNKAKEQVHHGLEQLQKLFNPDADPIDRRYWFAQLYRALVFAQVTFSDNTDEFEELAGKLRAILDGNFEIDWDGIILGYWVDKEGEVEEQVNDDGILICNVPQQRIQKILADSSTASYIPLSDEVIEEIDDVEEENQENKVKQDLEDQKKRIIDRRKKPSKHTEIPERENEQKLPVGPSDHEQEKKEDTKNEKSAPDVPQDDKKPSSITHTESSLGDLRILIGKDRTGNDVYWEYGHKGLSNRHLLITGTSGQGKTYGIQSMLYELSKANVSMVVFDYTEGFRKEQLEPKFLAKMKDRLESKIIYFTGVPINPFQRHEIEVAGMKAPEKISDVAQRIASTLTHVYSFGDQQFAAIYEACCSGLQKYGDNMSMRHLKSELNDSTNKSAKTVVSKMTPFLDSVEFSDERCDWEDILYNETGKLTIIQLTNFVREIQVLITEFMLWDMWHYTKKNGRKDRPFAVVLDEAQNLSHADNSPSGMILTEGRKFGWSAWYATQSLKVLNNDEVTRLLQSAFKLYFKPTDDEIVSMAKQLNPSDANEWKASLSSLKKGECIVVGDRIQKDGKFRPGRPTITKVTAFEERE